MRQPSEPPTRWGRLPQRVGETHKPDPPRAVPTGRAQTHAEEPYTGVSSRPHSPSPGVRAGSPPEVKPAPSDQLCIEGHPSHGPWWLPCTPRLTLFGCLSNTLRTGLVWCPSVPPGPGLRLHRGLRPAWHFPQVPWGEVGGDTAGVQRPDPRGGGRARAGTPEAGV